MKRESALFFQFESLPDVLQQLIFTFLDDQALANILRVKKLFHNRGKKMLLENKLSGISFFAHVKERNWQEFQNTLRKDKNINSENAISEIVQALYEILCKKENYDEEFEKLQKYISHPFIHEHVASFILRERWHYQEQAVLLKALELATQGVEYANRNCCILLASIYAKGLILRGETETVLIAQDGEEAEKYIIRVIDLSLGFGKGEEYAENLGEEKLFALVGQGVVQVIQFFSLAELETIQDKKLAALSFCQNPCQLLNFLLPAMNNDRVELIRMLNTTEAEFSESHLCMLATLLLTNCHYNLTLSVTMPSHLK